MAGAAAFVPSTARAEHDANSGSQSLLGSFWAHKPEIPVGILHSLSGVMASSEQAVAEATILAIEEINEAGGVLGGQMLRPLLVDGRSDWATFAAQAERLISRENVAVVFGCWTSASRKTVRLIFERHDHLLFYPVQYEGLEQSPNIIYTGAAPNQQIIPAVKWALDNLGHRFALVGSDYVFPRTANAIIRDQVMALGGQIVSEDYVALEENNFQKVIETVQLARPAVILNTLNGNSNQAFFQSLRAAGITPREIPTLSFSIGENELAGMDAASLVGDYAAWNYFQSLPLTANRLFLQKFRHRYGVTRVVSDPMEAAYFGVHLWAQAVEKIGSTDPRQVRDAVRNQSYAAPEGVVFVDPETQHTWKTVRIGRIIPGGQFDVVWDSGKPIRPVPYPSYRSKEEWNAFLQALYVEWHGNWARPIGDASGADTAGATAGTAVPLSASGASKQGGSR